jgi:hypothetical protein
VISLPALADAFQRERAAARAKALDEAAQAVDEERRRAVDSALRCDEDGDHEGYFKWRRASRSLAHVAEVIRDLKEKP